MVKGEPMDPYALLSQDSDEPVRKKKQRSLSEERSRLVDLYLRRESPKKAAQRTARRMIEAYEGRAESVEKEGGNAPE